MREMDGGEEEEPVVVPPHAPAVVAGWPADVVPLHAPALPAEANMIKLELQMKMQAVRQHMVQCLTECWDELKPEWHDLPPNSSRELRFPRFGMDVEVSSRFPELAQHGLTLFTQTVKPDVDAVGVWTFSCSLAMNQVREVFCFAMRTTSPTVVVTTDANGTICDAQGHPKLMPGYALIEEG